MAPLTDDWETFKLLSDAEITARALSDPDNPPTDAAFWKNAKVIPAQTKQPLSLRIDPDVLIWFRSFGKGYQTRMNAVLRAYVKAQSR